MNEDLLWMIKLGIFLIIYAIAVAIFEYRRLLNKEREKNKKS